MGIFEFVKNNFAHVFPILIAGAFAAAIIVERWKALFVAYPIANIKGFFEKIQDLVLAGKTSEAIAYCDQQQGKPVAVIVKSALARSHLPDEAIEQGVALTLGEESRRIQKRTNFLSTIANVATLLGLFGTIAGLIQSFQAVETADAQMKSKLLAAGIATAMNATMLGLAVAIPCMIAFSILVNRANKLTGEFEDSAMRSLDILKMRYFAQDPAELLQTPNNVTPINGAKTTERRAA